MNNDINHTTINTSYLFGNLNSSEFSKAPENVPLPARKKASED